MRETETTTPSGSPAGQSQKGPKMRQSPGLTDYRLPVTGNVTGNISQTLPSTGNMFPVAAGTAALTAVGIAWTVAAGAAGAGPA
ncbi:hypothetical protein, partial [Nocardia sp. NPDC003963]